MWGRVFTLQLVKPRQRAVARVGPGSYSPCCREMNPAMPGTVKATTPWSGAYTMPLRMRELRTPLWLWLVLCSRLAT